ncbi:protein kinase family protein [Aeromicrobium alkaliterrae]|uniref:Protein kinase domain-containing protein n=1 Tax=Aeromicrobium alkaliterrae TaxID=302168 RepID=A0ABP4W2L0_9ACTN
MAGRRTLVSGDVIAERYHLQDLVHERLGSTTWRAHDAVLSRNVGLELLPSSDPRAQRFLDAARGSTVVSDPRFLRVLDLITDDHGHHMIVREWARAFPLDAVLGQAPLPSWRAAAIVIEVAEALANAHERGQHHRRLTPHQVLLKESGAVRVVGLGVATALAPVGGAEQQPDTAQLERLDVQSLGKLLYACLVARWPGGHVDGLRAAPTEHGRVLRPRQVRAGVDREIDAICDRILGNPPVHGRRPITTATDVAHELRGVLTRLDPHDTAGGTTTSPDLVRYDPVVEPLGPPPGLEPPRPRPKAYAPKPPTTLERRKAQARNLTKGERGLVLLGAVGVLLILLVIAFMAGRQGPIPDPAPPTASATGDVGVLAIDRAIDFDPQGDGSENADTVAQTIDGDPETTWTTQAYRNRADLGGLKDGVGIILDLGATRQVDSVRLNLVGAPTSLQILTSAPGADAPPRSLDGLTSVASVQDGGTDVTVSLPAGTSTRYVVVWLTSLPQSAAGEFRGEIAEVRVDGRS